METAEKQHTITAIAAQDKPYQREIRCPIHNKLIGKYDARDGLVNATFYCPLCGREYTYTIKREPKL